MKFIVAKCSSCTAGCTYSPVSRSTRRVECSEGYEATQSFHLHSWILKIYYLLSVVMGGRILVIAHSSL